MDNLELNVQSVTRVEGHGNITVSVRDGKLMHARLDIVESPRFFEVLVQGRKYHEVAGITSRICGICAVAHTTASLRATEDAFGITPSAQTLALRKLVFHGEMLQSHILHVYFLVAPDLFGVGSVVPLAGTHGEVVKRALRMKMLANDLCALVGGRHVHPVAMGINGFTKLPDMTALEVMRGRFEAARADMDATVELFASVKLPEFEREAEYISLKGVMEYPFYAGDIISSHGTVTDARDYRDIITETVVPPNTAKHVHTKDGPFMVGALARYNNNHALLHPKAKQAASALGFAAPCHNPFKINIAQVVESVHCIEDAVRIMDVLLDGGMEREDLSVSPVPGRGVGVVEAPRGLLLHDYTYGPDGRATDANCIIPTGQNLANIEADMRAMIPGIIGRPEEEVAATLKMLVRAYDPCISCSTHSIDVEFV